MGSLASRNFVEMLEEEEITPSSPSSSNRVLDEALDPRSPTCGIVRTPIQVLKTPEFVHDPRSPTVGIDRTPICSNLAETPDETACEQEGGEVEMSRVLPLRLCELMEDLGCAQTDTKAEEEEPADSGECQATPAEHTKQKQNLVKKSKKQRSKVIGHTNSEADGSEYKQSVRSPLKVLGDRSPLTSRNVDYNSPRAIVQRKQASKLAIKKPVLQVNTNTTGRNSPVKYRPMAGDKENL